MKNRYLYTRVTQWARARYSTADGVMTRLGDNASRYAVIETLAAEKYLGCTTRKRPDLVFLPVFKAPAFSPGLVELQVTGMIDGPRLRRFPNSARAEQWCREIGQPQLIASIRNAWRAEA